ncbi:MAG: hypothetical protein R2702_17025 [Acidimicrobiales bacterium]
MSKLRTTRVLALAVVPLVLLLSSCKVSDITDPIEEVTKPIVDPLKDLFGLGDDEIATPRFELVNGITIQVVIRFDDIKAGIPVTVHLRCAGGTEATQTVTLHDTGSVAVGETTFTPAWPAGTDCIVSQDIVQGVDTVERAIEWLQSDEVQAVFDGA